MIYHTKICKMIKPDDPTHLFECDELLPNIFIGMCMWIEGNKYRIKDIKTIATKEICRQIIEVE